MGTPFDGPFAGITASIMTFMNRDAEHEAVRLLAPQADGHFLVLGFGGGVGVQVLARLLKGGTVLGIDPSKAMMRVARRRNRCFISKGIVRLERTTADAIPSKDEAFDGVIAVNTLQLCIPFEQTAVELARVMRPGAKLISLTHDWAMKHHASSVEAWLEQTTAALEKAGFEDVQSFPAKSEKGRSIVLTAQRKR